MTITRPLVALISAVPAAIQPAQDALAELFPQARAWNILDDRLLQDADEQGGVTPELAARMIRLIDHARTEGADGVLLTCSMYGSVAHSVTRRAGIPVYGPDDAVFEAAVASEAKRVVLVSSAAGPLADSVHRFTASAGPDVDVEGVIAVGAAAAARAGDTAALASSVVAAVEPFVNYCDAVLLGQYSLAPAVDALASRLALPVLSGPHYAAAALRRQIGTL